MTEIWSKPLVSGITLFSTEWVKEFQGIMEVETVGGCYPPLWLRKQRKLRAKLREGIFWAWNRDLWGGSKCCSADAGVSERIEGYSRPLRRRWLLLLRRCYQTGSSSDGKTARQIQLLPWEWIVTAAVKEDCCGWGRRDRKQEADRRRESILPLAQNPCLLPSVDKTFSGDL